MTRKYLSNIIRKHLTDCSWPKVDLTVLEEGWAKTVTEELIVSEAFTEYLHSQGFKCCIQYVYFDPAIV